MRSLSELSESARVLVEDLKRAGLAEGEAITVALDGTSRTQLERVRTAQQWNRLSEADARTERASIAEAARKRRETPVDEAAYDQMSASVFGRPVSGQ